MNGDSFTFRESGSGGFFITHQQGARVFIDGQPFEIVQAAVDQLNGVLRLCPHRPLVEIWNFVTGDRQA